MNDALAPAPSYRSRRFVLRTFPSPTEVDELASRLGWERIGETPEDPELNRPRTRSWGMAPGVVLNHMENSALEVSYIVVNSEHTPELSAHLSQIIEHGLDVRTEADLLDSVAEASSVAERALALVRAGIGAPLKPDNRYSRLFIDAVRSPHVGVRLHGLIAIAFAEWAPFHELLLAVAEQDDHPEVRSMAESFAEAFDAMGIGAST